MHTITNVMKIKRDLHLLFLRFSKYCKNTAPIKDEGIFSKLGQIHSYDNLPII